jgi:hypothetical protein
MRARILKPCFVEDVGDSHLEISRPVYARSWENEHRMRITLDPNFQAGESTGQIFVFPSRRHELARSTPSARTSGYPARAILVRPT